MYNYSVYMCHIGEEEDPAPATAAPADAARLPRVMRFILCMHHRNCSHRRDFISLYLIYDITSVSYVYNLFIVVGEEVLIL